MCADSATAARGHLPKVSALARQGSRHIFRLRQVFGAVNYFTAVRIGAEDESIGRRTVHLAPVEVGGTGMGGGTECGRIDCTLK